MEKKKSLFEGEKSDILKSWFTEDELKPSWEGKEGTFNGLSADMYEPRTTDLKLDTESLKKDSCGCGDNCKCETDCGDNCNCKTKKIRPKIIYMSNPDKHDNLDMFNYKYYAEHATIYTKRCLPDSVFDFDDNYNVTASFYNKLDSFNAGIKIGILNKSKTDIETIIIVKDYLNFFTPDGELSNEHGIGFEVFNNFMFIPDIKPFEVIQNKYRKNNGVRLRNILKLKEMVQKLGLNYLLISQ